VPVYVSDVWLMFKPWIVCPFPLKFALNLFDRLPIGCQFPLDGLSSVSWLLRFMFCCSWKCVIVLLFRVCLRLFRSVGVVMSIGLVCEIGLVLSFILRFIVSPSFDVIGIVFFLLSCDSLVFSSWLIW